MKLARRSFLKSIMGSSLAALSFIYFKPRIETIEGRVKRLFKKVPRERANNLAPLLGYQALSLREPDERLQNVSDKTFIQIIDNNIRQDFTENNIVNIAGWQLAHTEVAIMSIMALKDSQQGLPV